MSRTIFAGLLGCALLLPAPADAAAQQGLALKGGMVFNSSDVRGDDAGVQLSDAAGWTVGVEYLLGSGLGLGVSGYTGGSPDAFDLSEGSLVVLADANYFFGLPGLPVLPYLGMHVGLGTYRLQDVQDGVRPTVDTGDRGWQLGVRFQPMSRLGIDAQYRRVSGSLSGAQGEAFETRQFLLGVAIL